MIFVLAIMACLCAAPHAGVMPDVPVIGNPFEERGNRHARRRDAKRSRSARSA
jgi:hypothetical protein